MVKMIKHSLLYRTIMNLSTTFEVPIVAKLHPLVALLQTCTTIHNVLWHLVSLVPDCGLCSIKKHIKTTTRLTKWPENIAGLPCRHIGVM